MTTSKFLHSALFAGTLLAASFLTACDRTVETKTKTTDGPNGSTSEKQTVVEHNDGSVTVDKETKSSKP